MDNELLLRTGVFMACILTGIIVMKKSKGILPKLIITAVYIVAVLYYTLFSRMGIYGVAAVVDSGLSGAEHLRTWKDIVRDIFILRGYDRTGAAFLFNILLFVPLGYILPTLNKRFDGIVKMVLVGVIVSLIIETLQEFSDNVPVTAQKQSLKMIVFERVFSIMIMSITSCRFRNSSCSTMEQDKQKIR